VKKKVRLAAGVVGMTPALGMMMTASAAAAPAHTPKTTTKSVSLWHHNVAAAGGCIGHAASKAHSGNFHMSLFHSPNTGCIGGVIGSVKNDCSVGLVLRTRAYSISKHGRMTRWLNSTVRGQMHSCGPFNSPHPGTSYYQGIHQLRPGIQQVCDAIVFASNHDKTLLGPVCITV
jgi:hypothetical protein